MTKLLVPSNSRGHHVALVTGLPLSAPACLAADRAWVTRHSVRAGNTLYLASYWGESRSISPTREVILAPGSPPPFLAHPAMVAVDLTKPLGEIAGQPLVVKQVGSVESPAAKSYTLVMRSEDYRIDLRVLHPSLHPFAYLQATVMSDDKTMPDFAPLAGIITMPGALPMEFIAMASGCRCFFGGRVEPLVFPNDPSGETMRARNNAAITIPAAAKVLEVA